MQTLMTVLLVLGCSLYATWTLMPAALRRGAAEQLLKLPLPAWLTAPLRKATTASGGCGGCSSCDGAPAKPATVHVVRLHRGRPN